MGYVHFSYEDKKSLKAFCKNLPVFNRRYKHGPKAGEFIFEFRRCRGDKALKLGHKVDDKGLPLNPKTVYTIPFREVFWDPFDFFMQRLRELDQEISPELLDTIYKEYMAEYDTVKAQLEMILNKTGDQKTQ